MKIELNSILVSLLTLGISFHSGFAESNNLLRHRKLVELTNCATDCQSLPLIVGFKGPCGSAECQAGIMETVGVTYYQHLTNLGMIFVNEISDESLAQLQAMKNVEYIECDNCITSSADDPICGSDGKTYKNEAELTCGLKCRGADSSVSKVSSGACGSAIQSVQDDKLVALQNCPDDGSLALPLIVGFTDGCDDACSTQVMQKANIVNAAYTHSVNLNMITLNEVTEIELGVLRRESKYIKFIECDGEVTIDEDSGPSVGIGIGIVTDDVTDDDDDDSFDQEDDDAVSEDDDAVSEDDVVDDSEASVNSELCPGKVPDLGAAPQSCDSALTSECKYNPGPCMLNENETCYGTRCSCYAGVLECAVDSGSVSSSDGGNGGQVGIGIVEDDVVEEDDVVDDSEASINSELCPEKVPDLGAAPQSCDSALTSDCKYNPGPCMLNENETCYGTRCTCFAGALQCAVDSGSGSGGGSGGQIGIGIVEDDVVEEDNANGIELGNCPADGSLRLPLILTFAKDCVEDCAPETMKSAGIDVDQFVHLESLNMVTLKEVTDEQLVLLKANVENKIATIECDSEASIALENCPADGSLRLPLLITFHDKCGTLCASQTMLRLNIEESQYDHLTFVNIVILNSATTDELTALESETDSIKSIECDGEVTTLEGCDADCMTMPLIITFTKDCDTECASNTMQTSEVEKTSYEHLASLNIILLNDVTDAQLEALRSNGKVNTIECDSCVVANEVAEVCGTDGKTYKNEDELNCGLQCNGASPVQMAYFGACQAADDSDLIELGNCDADCMAMPLLFTFKESCDTACQEKTFADAGVASTKYDHLQGLDIIMLNEVSDGELTLLQLSGKNIATIECDSCASIAGGEVQQVCGSNGVTYASKDELDCGLKCRGADKSVTVEKEGVCRQVGVDELVPLGCESDCMRMPLIIGFKGDCDSDCALETMQRANIANSNFDHLSNLNMILLNTVTDEQLMILRGESKNILTMECDACASTADSPVCASNGVTFKSADQLTCDNQCRGAAQLSVAYKGECIAPVDPPSGGGGEFVLCFSSTNQVQLSDGEIKQINEIQLGDKVLTQNGYENVYSWSHYNTKKEAEFVQLLPSRVELSPNHLIVLENGSSVPAATIKGGDVLFSGEAVSSVRSVKRVGVYAPFTHSGTIVVNNQVASTFVSLQEKSDVLLLNGGFSTGISHQWLAHTFEFPHRLWCSAITDCTKESYTVDGISTWVASPLRFFTWFLDLPSTSQMILTVPILSLFGIFAVLDLVMKNYLAFGALLVSGLLLSRRQFGKCEN